MAAFGLPATVTVEGEAPVETTAFWLPDVNQDVPADAQFQRREPVKVLVLRKNEVPRVPIGTVVAMAEILGAAVEAWTVDGFERGYPDEHRVIVIRQAA